MEKVTETKMSLVEKVAEMKSLMSEKVNRMEEIYKLLHAKVDVIVGVVTRLVEFNMYTKQPEAKSENDAMVFENMEGFLPGVKELFMDDLSNKLTISPESLSFMVLTIELNIKTELAPIRNLILSLPANAPCVVHVSQGGDRGVGRARSSKDSDSEKGVVFGKVTST